VIVSAVGHYQSGWFQKVTKWPYLWFSYLASPVDEVMHLLDTQRMPQWKADLILKLLECANPCSWYSRQHGHTQICCNITCFCHCTKTYGNVLWGI